MYINAPVPRLMLQRAPEEHHEPSSQDDSSFPRPEISHQPPETQDSADLPLSYHFNPQKFACKAWPSPPPESPSPDPILQRGLKRSRDQSCQPYRDWTPAPVNTQSTVPFKTIQQLVRSKFCCLGLHHRRPPQDWQQGAAAIMAGHGGGADWAFPDSCEGVQDAYETRQLQNGFLAGTAGSPYNRLDGTTISMPLQHRIPSPAEQYHDFNHMNIPSGMTNDANAGFHSPAMPITGYNPLRYLDFPDMSGLSMFSTDNGFSPSSMHGLPMGPSPGIFTGLAGNNTSTPAPSTAFGSYSSSGNTSAPFASSFGSMTSTGAGSDVTSAGMAGSHHGSRDLGLGGSITSHAWPTATPDGTMSPRDIPLKRGPSPVSVTDQAPPLLLFHQDEHEHVEQDSAAEENLAVTTPTREASAAEKPSPPKKQRKSSDTSNPTKPRKSLPTKVPKGSRGRKGTASSQAQNRVEKSPKAATAPRRASQAKEKASSVDAAPAKAPATKKTSSTKASSKAASKKSAQVHRTLHSPVAGVKHLPASARGFQESALRGTDLPSAADEEPARQAAPHPDPARAIKDEFLLTSKQSGMTYREIREAGNFTEAESTLRGRYRTLTKAKENRVRKPEWSEKDVQLLRKAVRKYSSARAASENKGKVPWKLVAEYIHDKGGSYLFGNATCRKKWDELAAEKDKGKSARGSGDGGAKE